MEQSCKTIEISPNPASLIQSMRCIGYTLETALADIIDNSITAGASCISVQYRWNNGEPWIAVLDDGCGMSLQKLTSAMRFGCEASPSAKRGGGDLGRFGLGLKTASLSQCRRLTVVSKQCIDIHSCEWDVDFLVKEAATQWVALRPEPNALRANHVTGPLLSNLTEFKSGTMVVWRNLDTITVNAKGKASEDLFAATMDRASLHTGLIFHRFLSPDDIRKAIKIDFNGTAVRPFNPFGPAVAARQELPEESISVSGEKITVQPYVLPHYTKISRQDYEKFGGGEGYLHNQGFYIYRNKRLIVKGTWFRLVPKTELTKLLRVRVDIPNSLDHLWQLDVKKSQAHPPQVVLDELKRIIEKIANRGKFVYTRRGARTVDDTIHVWRREITDGKVSYIINEEHPFARSLVEDGNGSIDQGKLSCLRIISGAFPLEVFHADANNDDKIEIVSAAQKDEMAQAVANLIHSLHECGLDEVAVRKQLDKNELPVSEEELNKLIAKEFHG